MNRKHIIGIAVLAAIWFVAGWLCLADFIKYLFLSIGFTHDFAMLAVHWLVIPGVFLAVKCFLRNRQTFQTIATVLFCISLLAAYVASLSLMLYAVPTYSYTEDIKNIGKYDKYVEYAMKDADEAWFPDKLPEGAVNAQYYFRYYNAAAPNYFVLLIYQVEDAEIIEQVRQNLTAYKMIDQEMDGEIYRWEKESCASIAETAIDAKAKTIYCFFVRSSEKDQLPLKLEDLYSVDWREIVRLR